ncbi:MAG: TolB-like 6-bladed beta-propeller domain-containing protein [Tannerella sp.]|jgi:hypothetical protein|nr:TolB-like 6-bladed beta-propeller domain-containing protein [Tannerella sp.]
MPFKMIKTAYGQYLGLASDKGFLTLRDQTGKEIANFFEYPYRDSDDWARKTRMRAIAYQGILATNPQKTKLVYMCGFGEIIHFYDIKKDRVSVIRKIEARFPNYTPIDRNAANSRVNGAATGGQGQIVAAATSKQDIVAYIFVAATDQYVYLLYRGKPRGETDGKLAKELRKFDWKGKLVETYGLDVPCQYICVSPDDKKLWAIAIIEEATPVCFDLPATAR